MMNRYIQRVITNIYINWRPNGRFCILYSIANMYCAECIPLSCIESSQRTSGLARKENTSPKSLFLRAVEFHMFLQKIMMMHFYSFCFLIFGKFLILHLIDVNDDICLLIFYCLMMMHQCHNFLHTKLSLMDSTFHLIYQYSAQQQYCSDYYICCSWFVICKKQDL